LGCGLGWAEGSTSSIVGLYSPGGPSVPSHVGELALTGKYD